MALSALRDVAVNVIVNIKCHQRFKDTRFQQGDEATHEIYAASFPPFPSSTGTPDQKPVDVLKVSSLLFLCRRQPRPEDRVRPGQPGERGTGHVQVPRDGAAAHARVGLAGIRRPHHQGGVGVRHNLSKTDRERKKRRNDNKKCSGFVEQNINFMRMQYFKVRWNRKIKLVDQNKALPYFPHLHRAAVPPASAARIFSTCACSLCLA